MIFTEKAKIVDRHYQSCAHKLQVLSFNINLIFSPQRVPRQIYPFRQKSGRSGKGSFSKKVKSLIEVPYVSLLKVQFPSFNMNLFPSPQRDPSPSSPLRGNIGDQVRCRSPIKLKQMIELPLLKQLKVQVVIFNMNLFSSPQRVPRPSYPFREKFGRSGKMLFIEKAKIIDRDCQSCALESIGCKLQYEHYLFSVACSYANSSISVKIWEVR